MQFLCGYLWDEQEGTNKGPPTTIMSISTRLFFTLLGKKTSCSHEHDQGSNVFLTLTGVSVFTTGSRFRQDPVKVALFLSVFHYTQTHSLGYISINFLWWSCPSISHSPPYTLFQIPLIVYCEKILNSSQFQYADCQDSASQYLIIFILTGKFCPL